MECLSSRREREPPGGRARENRKFIQAPSPEIWSETISGGEEVLAGKWGGLFLGYLLEKNFRRRDRDHLVPPGGWMHSLPCRGVLSFRSGAREASGSETPRVHNVAWWCGGVPLTVRAQQPERVRRIGVLLML